ncbi:MAG: hypothetical protein AW07_04418 [Candidatus Accumulibacter sp. SK-11]|nr:MAG: hypothetical protein AW07_04418 [Candidatus Accumulibacter sp. SK-11]
MPAATSSLRRARPARRALRTALRWLDSMLRTAAARAGIRCRTVRRMPPIGSRCNSSSMHSGSRADAAGATAGSGGACCTGRWLFDARCAESLRQQWAEDGRVATDPGERRGARAVVGGDRQERRLHPRAGGRRLDRLCRGARWQHCASRRRSARVEDQGRVECCGRCRRRCADGRRRHGER